MATIHASEVASHCNQDSCWVVIHDKVWDVTSMDVFSPAGLHIDSRHVQIFLMNTQEVHLSFFTMAVKMPQRPTEKYTVLS